MIENVIAARDINSAMENISKAQERVIFLCVVGGHSHEHAAQVTGLPLGTVKTNVRRGKIQLKNHLQAWRKAA
jgi:DNA-directed RNA polymerase specialized sigma24 family protein